jgi:hypothetical protein
MADDGKRTGKRAEGTRDGSGAVFLIKPVSKRFGLDYLHISLIILVIVLVALAFSFSNFKPSILAHNCQYGVVNNTCATPKYNSSEAISAAERILAGYSTINSSLSLLPYYSLVNQSRAYYLLNGSEWLVVIPYINPYTKEVVNTSMILYASNLTLAEPFMQMIGPILKTQNRVISPGTIDLSGKTACANKTPIPVYYITDPYAPGALRDIGAGINASSRFGSSINVSYMFIFAGYSVPFYSTYGANTTQALGEYLACASAQPRFPAFVANLSKVYFGNPISNTTLYSVAVGSGLDMGSFSACMDNVSLKLDYQSKLAQYYNITTAAPAFVTNCKYLSIPETLNETISYALKNASLTR